MAAKHKNTVYKPPNIPNPFQEGQDKAYGDLLFDYMQSNKKWRNTTYLHLGCFILSLVFFLIAISQQDIVPVLVNVMPSGEPQYLGEVRQTSSFQVPEAAIVFQIRTFISNLRTISTDYMVVYRNIDDCFHMSTQTYTPILRRILTENSPFELVGSIRRNVEIESILLITGRTYQINWTEVVHEPASNNPKRARFRAVITIVLASPTPQTIVRNPLGIYIENLEMTEL